MVGRPRQFDYDEVLDAAMQAFWAKGYEATSLADLMAATGLHKGSLYQAYGDKHTLFLQALKRYLEGMLQMEFAAMSTAATPLDGLRAAAHAMIDIADDASEAPKGCMAVNSLVELAPHDAEVRAIMEAHIERVRKAIEGVVVKAQNAGQVGHDQSPELIARLVMTFVSGLSTSIKCYMRKTDAHALLDAQLDAVLLPAAR